MSFGYRLAPSNVLFIILSPCEAAWNKLSPTELQQPTEEEWKKKAEEFHSLWQFPNYIGAIDDTFKYEHRITVAPFSLITERCFLYIPLLWSMPVTSLP
jgi:hypothetical protein